MQYKIPQNVGIEDKIVGPFSLRQLIMVAGGVGVSWVLFAIMSKVYELNFIEYAVIALPGLISVAFALVRVNDQTLLKYIMLLMEFSMKPKKRLWDHRGISSLVAPDLGETVQTGPSPLNASMLEKSKKASNLSQLSLVLDSGGFKHLQEIQHRDMDQAQDENLVTEAYFGNDEREKMNMYWRTIESHKKRLDFFAKLPTTQLKTGTKETELVRQEIAKAKEAGEAARKIAITIQTKPKAPGAPLSRPAPAPKTEPKATQQPPKPIAKSAPEKPAPAPRQPSSTDDTPRETTKPVPRIPVAKPAEPTPRPTPKPQPSQPAANPKIPTPKPVPQPQKPANPQPAKAANGNTPTPQPSPRPATGGGPVRQGHVDTTKKNAPAQYVQKPPQKPQPPAKPTPNPAPSRTQEPPKATPPEPKAGPTGGEFQFEELKKGEIEINLD